MILSRTGLCYLFGGSHANLAFDASEEDSCIFPPPSASSSLVMFLCYIDNLITFLDLLIGDLSDMIELKGRFYFSEKLIASQQPRIF